MPEITYTQVGDYLLPDIIVDDEAQSAYGKYGMLRKTYLKEKRKGTYAQLLLSGQLNQHLTETDMLVHDFLFRLVKEIATKQGVD